MVSATPISNPPNPWLSSNVEYLEEIPEAKLEIYEDATREILSTNDSPDLGFRYSVNPYRGCVHGCAYCYARPSHEYLGFGAGSDFERKIVVKLGAPELLKAAFEKPSWQGETIFFSGVTDCYQPIEAEYRLTARCLAVCRDYRNPVAIVTKGALVERDLDLLEELAATAAISVSLSIPFWDESVARALEPYAPSPRRRMRTIEKLAARGIAVGINVAPVIPALNDADIGRLLKQARQSGARFSSMVVLRLPGSVEAVFWQRLAEALPLRSGHVASRLRDTFGGRMYKSNFGIRQRGVGVYAQAIEKSFHVLAARLGFRDPPQATQTTFCRPSAQLALF